MHRHGYKGTKFGRERDQREALIQSLAEALIAHGSIKTTASKAKALVPYVEKLVTKAKKGDLHNRRQVISGLQTVAAAHKLVDEIAPKLTGRTSGHFRIERLDNRKGDNAEMARVSFVDDLKEAPVAKAEKVSPKKQQHDRDQMSEASVKKPAPKSGRSVKAADNHLSHKPTVQVRKSGER
ncbi:50S ribosomal protein L17 [Candidatus Saccharibacteria bacterium]|nr:50S ribosomal protein L17 [Candidatus Saccharibacteria bacterium]